jgi:hypothetical protein
MTVESKSDEIWRLIPRSNDGLTINGPASSRIAEPSTWELESGWAGFEPAASSSRTERAARQVSWSVAFRYVRGIHAGHDRCI